MEDKLIVTPGGENLVADISLANHEFMSNTLQCTVQHNLRMLHGYMRSIKVLLFDDESLSIYIAVLTLGRVWPTSTLYKHKHQHKLLSEPFLARDSEQSLTVLEYLTHLVLFLSQHLHYAMDVPVNDLGWLLCHPLLLHCVP